MRPRAEPGEVQCGRPFQAPTSAALRLTARFPESVSADAQTAQGSVEISSREPIQGVTPAAADVFLVTNDRVVTMPVAQDAIGIRWAGEMRTLPAVASLVPCDPGARRLLPGVYELYARVVVTPDEGKPQPCFGGPWPLRVR
jgi:hypothetical protein